MMEIFFLGTSAGLPSVTRGMPCIALRHNKHIILFDAGECCQKELMKAAIGFGSIRHIFISHLHLDHFLGIFGLIETLRLSTNISNETLNIYSPGNFEKLLINKWPFIKCNRLKEGYTVNFGDFDVKAFRVKHENEAFGFVIKEIDRIKFNEEKAEKLGIKGKMFKEILKKGKIKTEKREVKLEEVSFIKKGRKIVYTGDTAYSDAIVKEAKDADVLIHEATFDESMQKEAEARKHSTVKDAALTAHKAGVKMLVLTHISSRYKKGEESLLLEQAKKYYKGKIIIAYDGLKIEI
jgi:ribonuclease Z